MCAVLRAGASGFLLKRARPTEIVRAVRTATHGDSLLFPTAIRRLAAAHGRGGRQVHDTGLTERELQVLCRMARGLPNAAIAAELALGVQTVKTHVSNVLATRCRGLRNSDRQRSPGTFSLLNGSP